MPQTVVADAGSGKLNLTSALTFDAVGNHERIKLRLNGISPVEYRLRNIA